MLHWSRSKWNLDLGTTLNSTLNVTNATILASTLEVQNDVSLNTALSVGGAVSMNSTLEVFQDSSFNSNMYIEGVITLSGDIVPAHGNVSNLGSVDKPFGSLYISNNTINFGGASAEDAGSLSFKQGGLEVQASGAEEIQQLLSVVDNKVAIGKASQNATTNLDISGTMWATSDVSFNSGLSIGGATTIDSTLQVDKATTLSSTLGVTGATTLSSTLGVTEATTLSSTLAVTEATTLSSTLAVTEATTLSSTLGVTGATTLSSTLGVTGAATLSSTLGVTEATTLSSTLAVTDATTLSSTLAVTDATTLSSTLLVSENTTLQQELYVTGDSSFNANMFVSGNMGINAQPNNDIVMDISSTNAIRLPKGQNADRPVQNDANASYKGLIRYNSEQDQFEGFGAGNAWGSLGGVKDVDQDTYIIAETSAGADNDQLQFYTAGSERLVIDANGDASFNHGVNIVGATTMESTLRVENSMGINTDPSSGIVLDISASNAIRLPKG